MEISIDRVREKHRILVKLIGEEKTTHKLNQFYNRQILQAKKADTLSHVPLNFESNVQEIISHLNQLTGQDFRWKSKETQASIKARLNEGNNIEDFKHVHEIKTREWLENPQMRQHLNPSTLYRPSNFEKYRNQYKMWKQQQREAKEKKIAQNKPKKIKKLALWYELKSIQEVFNYVGSLSQEDWEIYKLPKPIEELRAQYVSTIGKLKSITKQTNKKTISKEDLEKQFQTLKKQFLESQK